MICENAECRGTNNQGMVHWYMQMQVPVRPFTAQSRPRLSVDSQLRSKRLRWFGHICRMSDSRLPKVLMHGHLVGQDCGGRPRVVWNDVVWSDIHKWNLNCYTP